MQEDMLSLKPIFSCGMNEVYDLLKNYESAFDYILLEKDNTLNEFELISLLLRSKNKIILLN